MISLQLYHFPFHIELLEFMDRHYIDKAWYSILPMGYEELKTAVERPAALVNLQFRRAG